MSPYNPELPKFLDVLYLPDHEKMPGYLGVKCLFEEHPGWEKTARFAFQYLDGKVFFRVYPTGVQFPLGEVSSLDEAIEIAKQFLKKWLGHGLEDLEFQSETAEAILQLEEEQRKEKELRGRKWLEENQRFIEKGLEEYRKQLGKDNGEQKK